MYSRREFGKIAISGMSLAALPGASLWAAPAQSALFGNSNVRGVRLGIIGGGLRGGAGGGRPGGAGGPGGPGGQAAAAPATPPPAPAPPVDPMVAVDQYIDDLKTLGIQYLESGYNAQGQPRLMGGTQQQNSPKAGTPVTPQYTESREAIRQWRLTAPLDPHRAIAAKFKAAGIDLFSGVVTIEDDCTDAEIEAIFKRLEAIGVKTFCTNGTRVGIAPRIAPFAEKYKITPAFHTHDASDDPNEVASRDSLERLLAMSPQFMINLDIGHYTAGNQDALAFVRDHHDRISHLHMKDRKKDHGPSVVWGTGDTPITPILLAIRDNKWPIRCIIERDNRDEQGTPLELTKKYMDYMKRVLET
jgi:sugar phosphate isomerase/epimerase